MKRYILPVILACVAFGAFAVPVTSDQAMAVATSWLVKNPSFGVSGTVLDAVPEYDTDGTNVLWWTVRLSGGGAIFAAPDTGIEPVLAAVAKYAEMPAVHPLRALMTGDVRARKAALAAVEEADAVSAAAVPNSGPARLSASAPRNDESLEQVRASISRATSKWAGLAQAASASSPKRPQVLRADVADVTVSGQTFKIIDGFQDGGKYTFWNQTTSPYAADPSGNLFNLYTPNNYPCGCVATAFAAVLQVMNVTNAPDIWGDCTVDGVDSRLMGMGKPYDWGSLPVELGGKAEDFADNGNLLTDEQADVIARATYDMGVAVSMDYTASGSGAYDHPNVSNNYRPGIANLVTNILINKCGMSAAKFESFESNPKAEDYSNFIYNEVTNGYPCVLSIHGSGFGGADSDAGHEVLAVGYGKDSDEDGGTEYTRIFLGWGGSNDGWYALPDITVYLSGGTSGYMWKTINSIAWHFRNETRFLSSMADAKTAALQSSPEKPVLMVSGDDTKAATRAVLDYLDATREAIEQDFVICYVDCIMTEGDGGTLSFAVFNSFDMEVRNRWLASNGRISYAAPGGDVAESEALAALSDVMDGGLDGFARQTSDIKLTVTSSMPEAVGNANPDIGEHVGLWRDGETVSATCDLTFTNSDHTVVMGCGGWTLTNATTGAVMSGSGNNAQFMVAANDDLTLTWQMVTNKVYISVSPSPRDDWGTWTPSSGWYDYGTPVEFTAIPANRRGFSCWRTKTGGNLSLFGAVTDGMSVVVPATMPIQLQVVFTRQGSGSGTPTQDVTEHVIDWNDTLDNLSEGYSTNLVSEAALAAAGLMVTDLSVTAPTGWVVSVSSDGENVSATLTMDEDALMPVAADGGSPLEITTEDDGSITISADIANGLRGFWYSLFATDDLSDSDSWELVSTVQSGLAGQNYSKQAQETGVVSLEISFDPSEAKMFYKVVVTDRNPSAP